MIREKLQKIQVKRLVILNLPYFFIFYVADKGSWLYRHCLGESMVQRLGVMLVNFRLAFLSWLPSIALQMESDWYNAQVELLRLSSETWGNGLIQIEEGDFSLMRWYEYTLTLEPGQTLKNAVTAPLYPAIDAGYTPSLYSYTYLLSPAKTWAQFGELKVVVNTPYYMTECGIDGFTKTDGGYALTLPGLPEGELTFTLSESENPQPPKWSGLYIMPTEFIIVVAAVLATVGVAVFLLSRRKKRTKR